MKVIVFTPWYNAKHRTVLGALAEGIPDAEVRDVRRYEPCDVAVIFGLVKLSFDKTWSKSQILRHHQRRRLLVVESAFCRRGEYWAIGWGGLAGRADFRADDVPNDRWKAIGIDVKPWQHRPGPIVVCGQLPRDTSVQSTDHPKWCREAVAYYMAQGREVWFRPHPRCEDSDIYGVDGVRFDTGDLAATLDQAQAFVTYNSTSGVDAVLAGIPVVACDRGSRAWDMASHSFEADLKRPIRARWLAGLGYSQWTAEEMRAGLPWQHLTRP